jgi:hypothetical protein
MIASSDSRMIVAEQIADPLAESVYVTGRFNGATQSTSVSESVKVLDFQPGTAQDSPSHNRVRVKVKGDATSVTVTRTRGGSEAGDSSTIDSNVSDARPPVA